MYGELRPATHSLVQRRWWHYSRPKTSHASNAGLTPCEEWSVDAVLADGDWCVLALKTDPGDYDIED